MRGAGDRAVYQTHQGPHAPSAGRQRVSKSIGKIESQMVVSAVGGTKPKGGSVRGRGAMVITGLGWSERTSPRKGLWSKDLKEVGASGWQERAFQEMGISCAKALRCVVQGEARWPAWLAQSEVGRVKSGR